MASIFCPECGAKAAYTLNKPKFCQTCGQKFGDVSASASTSTENEEELTEEGIPYEVGKAHFKEISRGQIIGDELGMLKLIFGLEDHKLLGVHIIGEGATELVHIGQAVLAFDDKIDYFVNTVFNYPTLAEAYKVAALDGINRLSL